MSESVSQSVNLGSMCATTSPQGNGSREGAGGGYIENNVSFPGCPSNDKIET